jgi:hypothetical protein
MDCEVLLSGLEPAAQKRVVECGSRTLTPTVLRSWEESLAWASRKRKLFAYRGQQRDWRLTTELDREFERLGITVHKRASVELNLRACQEITA